MTQTPFSTTCDVAVIGGGPAGSTAAALLAQRGYRVIVLEKDRHRPAIVPQAIQATDGSG